jgi:hypothetical protein
MTYNFYVAFTVAPFVGGILFFLLAGIMKFAGDYYCQKYAWIAGVVALVMELVALVVCIASPSEAIMVENSYKEVLNSRPECVKDVVNNDFTTVPLKCAEDYIHYRADSISKANMYFRIKERVYNKLEGVK